MASSHALSALASVSSKSASQYFVAGPKIVTCGSFCVETPVRRAHESGEGTRSQRDGKTNVDSVVALEVKDGAVGRGDADVANDGEEPREDGERTPDNAEREVVALRHNPCLLLQLVQRVVVREVFGVHAEIAGGRKEVSESRQMTRREKKKGEKGQKNWAV